MEKEFSCNGKKFTLFEYNTFHVPFKFLYSFHLIWKKKQKNKNDYDKENMLTQFENKLWKYN